jgi:acyl carrier protein
MEPASTPSAPSAPPPVRPEDKIRHLPEGAKAALRAYQTSGDVAALDPLIFAILENFAPRKPARPLAEHPGSTLLMDDLGFDSLAITEIVFFTEDLFEISIANEEILRVRSLDDLRTFIRAKVATRAAA